MQISAAGTGTGFESTVSRVEFFITWRPINHYPQTGKPPSHSATPEPPELLTSSLARVKNVEYDIQGPGESCRTEQYTSRQCQDPCEQYISKCFRLKPRFVCRHGACNP
jgi:hypothetical protein